MTIFSGIQYRSFAGQNEFSFYFDLSHSTSYGISEIGFSGEQNILPIFLFKSGNIFDINQKNVWSYSPRDIISFSGNIGSNYLNYFINEMPVCLYLPKNNNFYYDNLYVKTQNSIIDYNFYIKGLIPSYDIIFPDTAIFGQDVTGEVKNKENNLFKSFKIFSGIIFNQNTNYSIDRLPLFVISGNQSGQIILRPNILNQENISRLTPSNLNLFLNTNFGNVLQNVSFNLIPAPVYFIEFFTGFTGVTGLLNNALGKYYNYELRTILPEDEEVHIFLKNISGHTGQLIYDNYTASGNTIGNISGFIYGFEYLTGFTTGLVTAIFRTDYYGNFPKEIVSNKVRSLRYATGIINYNYRLPLFGGSGIGPSPIGTTIPASGILTESLTGFVFGYGSYSNNKNIQLTGYYFDSINIKTELQTLTTSGFFTGLRSLNYKNVFWTSQKITGVGYTGFNDKIYDINGSISNQINTINSGTINFGTIYSPGFTGNILLPRIKQNSGLFVNSGSAFSSENSSLAKNAFTGDNYFYLTNNTGDIIFHFNNYNSANKGRIFYYSFELDFSASKYPYIFDFQLSTNGTTWSTIDSRSGNELFLSEDPLNFYAYPKEIILPCQNFNTILNSTLYQYARINIRSGKNWPHNFTPPKTSEGIGIKNIECYTRTFGSVDPLNTIFTGSVVPNLTGYDKPSQNILNNDSFLGNVIYSNDSPLFPAWYAFNEDKNLYPYSEITNDINDQLFLGYSINNNIFTFSGVRIEFEETNIPNRLILQISRDGFNFNAIYQTNSNSESTFIFSPAVSLTGCKSVRLLF